MQYIETVVSGPPRFPGGKKPADVVKCGAYKMPRRIEMDVVAVDEELREWLTTVVLESTQKATRVTEMTTRAPKGGTLADFDSEIPMQAIKHFLALWLTEYAISEELIEPNLRTAYYRRAYLWVSARVGNESPQMGALRRWEEEFEPLGMSQGEAAEEMGLGYATLRTYLGEARKEREQMSQHERGK